MKYFKTFFKTQNSSTSKNKAKLVDSQGTIQSVNLPITIAELMLENPGFAVVPVQELRKSQRLTAMRADDMLDGRKVYLLVPVDKVNSRLSDLQLAAVDFLISSSCNEKFGKKTRGGGSKVSPLLESSSNSNSDLVKDLGGWSNGITGQRKRFCKGWEPVLEPILEGC